MLCKPARRTGSAFSAFVSQISTSFRSSLTVSSIASRSSGIISAFHLFLYQADLMDVKIRIKKQQDVRYVLLLSCLPVQVFNFQFHCIASCTGKQLFFYFYLFRKFCSVFTTYCNTVKQLHVKPELLQAAH